MNRLNEIFHQRGHVLLPVIHVVLVATLCLSALAAEVFGAVTFTTAFSFSITNGALPEATLIQGTDGFLYGTTLVGGTNGAPGTVFRISTNGVFKSMASLDAGHIQAGVIQAIDGNFYGVSYDGGDQGAGSVFRMTPEGAVTTVTSFNYAQSSHPNGLVQGVDGSFYGTTYYGGASGNGTVFKLTSNGVLSTLVSFNGENGAHPQAPLSLAADGALYGATLEGGTNGGFGTVFQLTRDVFLTSLVSFNGTNGHRPYAPPALGRDGNLYGLTGSGGPTFNSGSFNDHGTVYRITPGGKFTSLVAFDGTSGSLPTFCRLIEAADGRFYGTTERGGTYRRGSVFRVTTNGVVTTLFSFNGTNGADPSAGLLQAADGAFYGTTLSGGENDVGTVFRLSVPDALVAPSAALLTLTRMDDGQQLFGQVEYRRRLGASHASITLSSNAPGGQFFFHGMTTFTATPDTLSFAGLLRQPRDLRATAPITLSRSGSRYAGVIALFDDSAPPSRNSVQWNMEIADLNDADEDGVPDISDALPPMILLQPKSRTFKAGKTVVLTTRAQGEGPLWFQWQFNGQNIAGATNRALRLSNTQFAQAGDFRVMVSGPGGVALSSSARLTIK